ncbi:hypothetical protein Y032_0319g2365 [Ancylostoma ceylanicum]|uniref:Uncharacterized protein n=1 Tax=Ancylostoma ceylanicum TaxID=53326 RepID=A0A016S1C1_9BILA|nr:hypothetical protein Y032_0319g2365 [Ancylostoma ceylanicum]
MRPLKAAPVEILDSELMYGGEVQTQHNIHVKRTRTIMAYLHRISDCRREYAWPCSRLYEFPSLDASARAIAAHGAEEYI